MNVLRYEDYNDMNITSWFIGLTHILSWEQLIILSQRDRAGGSALSRSVQLHNCEETGQYCIRVGLRKVIILWVWTKFYGKKIFSCSFGLLLACIYRTMSTIANRKCCLIFCWILYRKSIPMDKLIAQFKRDYYAAGKWDLDIQVCHLARLADYYLEKYKKYEIWTDCLKVSRELDLMTIKTCWQYFDRLCPINLVVAKIHI